MLKVYFLMYPMVYYLGVFGVLIAALVVISIPFVVTAFTRPRISGPLIVNLRGFEVECVTGDARR